MFRLVKMMKYTKIEQMVQRSALKKLFLGPLRRASGQKPRKLRLLSKPWKSRNACDILYVRASPQQN